MAAGGRGPHAEERAVSEATPGRRRDEHLRDVDPIVIRWTSPMRPMELWWFGPGPTDGCRCRPKLAALSWAPTRCSGAAVLRERRRERRGWAATGGGAKERRRGWGLGKNRLKRYFFV